MDRPIKFRAWLKEEGFFDYQDDFDNKSHFFKCHLGKTELMQYIGLKDKDGKEIYEGDILNLYVKENWADSGWIGRGSVFWDGEKAKFLHGFQEVMDGKLIDGYRPPKAFWNSHRTEVKVIGNKFENPELIE